MQVPDCKSSLQWKKLWDVTQQLSIFLVSVGCYLGECSCFQFKNSVSWQDYVATQSYISMQLKSSKYERRRRKNSWPLRKLSSMCNIQNYDCLNTNSKAGMRVLLFVCIKEFGLIQVSHIKWETLTMKYWSTVPYMFL